MKKLLKFALAIIAVVSIFSFIVDKYSCDEYLDDDYDCIKNDIIHKQF